ncbi:MAG: hypothetical protein NTW87_12020 [Planctomycetota bacterium]|nr:hypothetical protein [Planctomycetota bacterium]
MSTLIPIKRGEGTMVCLAALWFFLTLVSYYILKPVRDALYIHELGAGNLPYVYLAQSGLALLLTLVYDRAFNALPRRPFLLASYLFLAASMPVFWLLLQGVPAWHKGIVVAFHLWISLFSVTAVALFWSLANETFSLDAGKRLYGLVGAAGPLGGLVGSGIAQFCVRAVGTLNLILLSAVLLTACIPVMLWLTRQQQHNAGSVHQVAEGSSCTSGLGHIFRSRYLACIAAVVCLMNIAAMVYDVQVLTVFEDVITNRDEKTRFLSSLYVWVNVLALGVQLLLTGPVHRRFGPVVGLICLPLVVAAAAVTVLLTRALAPLACIFVVSSALAYSINQVSKEVLYIPTTSDVKYKAKAAIDIFVFRLGDALGAVFLLGMTQTLGWPVRQLAYFSLAFAVIWLLIVLQLSREYGRFSRSAKKAGVASCPPEGLRWGGDGRGEEEQRP